MKMENLIGFVRQNEGEIPVEQKLCVAIQAVLDASEPTEEKVRRSVRAFGYKIETLNFSPHEGAAGEIRGGKMVRFKFTAVNGRRIVKGGTLS